MESHQKYFPTFNDKNEITNEFLIVTNKKDKKGLIKVGNERVVDARLSDAEFFWNKEKTQNLVKKVSELKSIKQFPKFNNEIDRNSLAMFLRFNSIPAPYSIYEKIYKLEPGQIVKIHSK